MKNKGIGCVFVHHLDDEDGVSLWFNPLVNRFCFFFYWSFLSFVQDTKYNIFFFFFFTKKKKKKNYIFFFFFFFWGKNSLTIWWTMKVFSWVKNILPYLYDDNQWMNQWTFFSQKIDILVSISNWGFFSSFEYINLVCVYGILRNWNDLQNFESWFEFNWILREIFQERERNR